MAVFKINIKRLLKDKFNLFLMIILPSIAVTLSTFFTLSVESSYKIGIITDKEKSKVVKLIEKELKKCFDVKTFDPTKSIVSQMVQSGIDCVVVLKNKSVDDIINEKQKNIKIYTFGKSETHIILKEYLNSVFKILAAQKRINSSKFLESSKYIFEHSPIVLNKIFQHQSNSISIAFASGFFIMSLLWLALNASNIILKDYQERVILRILCSPISKQSYILQSILSIFSITFLQLIFFVLLCSYAFRLTFGTNILIVISVLSICSFMFVAFAVMFISIVNDMRKLASLNSMVVTITIMCMLGGCYWPLSIMPKFLQKIALFFPTTYAVNLTKNVLTGKSIESMMVDIAQVAAFCLFFTLVGIKQLSKNVMSKL